MMRAALCLLVVAALVAPAGCAGGSVEVEWSGPSLSVTSMAFAYESGIPARHTCQGEDISPELSWSGVPEGTESFAVICEDPDAIGVWTHWVIFNVAGDATGVPEGVPNEGTLPDGALQGENSWKRIGYRGPCPPAGTHRYIFTAYALDTLLPLEAGASKRDVLAAISGHVLAMGELIGMYPG